MGDIIQLPTAVSKPMDTMFVILHPDLSKRLINGQKTAFMCQENFLKNQPILFQSHDANTQKLVDIASATATDQASLRISPLTEKMELKIFDNRGEHWKRLDKNTVYKVLINEGFLHPDDFWSWFVKFLGVKKPFETRQFYFSNLKLINQ